MQKKLFSLLLFFQISSLWCMDSISQKITTYVRKKIEKLIQPPLATLQAPRTHIITPTEIGTIEIEAISILIQLKNDPKLKNLSKDVSISCSVIISNPSDEGRVKECFKKFKGATFKKMKLEPPLKVAVEVTLEKKQQKARL